MHLRAIDHHARSRVVGHLLKGHRGAQRVAGEILSSLGILGRHPHRVMRREPRVAPAEHAATKLVSERLIFHEKIEHRAPKALGKQSLRHGR